MVQRVQERTLVLVVVVNVRPLQRLDRGPVGWRSERPGHGDETGAEQRGEPDEDAGERHTTSAVHRARGPRTALDEQPNGSGLRSVRLGA